VAVSSRERDVDPVGACVGMRGARVQAIMRELRGERIDIIQFSDDLITYAQNALSPAKITRVSAMPADEATEVDANGDPIEPVPTLECIVEEDQLSLAIGKRGQNVRLAAALIGAKIEIKSEQAVKAEVAQALQRMLVASQRRGTALAEIPGISEEQAEALSAVGLNTLGELLDTLEANADDEDPLAGVPLDTDGKNSVIEAGRAFEAAPEPEPEESNELLLEGEEGAEGEEGEEGQAGEEAASDEGGAEEPAESGEAEGEPEGPRADTPAVTETPEK
jgi:N utilization substance protein A